MKHSDIINAILTGENITKSEFADILGVSKQFVYEVAKGNKSLSFEKLNKLKSLYPSHVKLPVFKLPDKITPESLVELRAHFGLSQAQLADKLEISQTLVTKYEKGDRNISKSTIFKLRSLFSDSNINSEHDNRVISIPYYSDTCTHPSFNLTCLKKPSRYLRIDKTLLADRENLPIQPDKCVILNLGTNSLSPIYEPLDRIILDTSFDKFYDGYIFAFIYEGNCYVMQIYTMPDKIKCIPLNEKQDTFYISRDSNYTILGLIVPRIRL